MTNPIHSDELEQRAENQRRRLHNSVLELKSSVRETLDVKKAARTHIWKASAVGGLIAFVVGYGIAGAFTN